MSNQHDAISADARRKLASARVSRFVPQLVSVVLAITALILLTAGIAMLLDWIFAFRSIFLRVPVSLAALLGCCFLMRRVRAKLHVEGGLTSTAKWLDTLNPMLDERVITLVDAPGNVQSSPELLQAVGTQVDRIGIRFHIREAVVTRPFIAVWAAMLVAIGLVGMLWWFSGAAFPALASRLINPFSSITLTLLPKESKKDFCERGKTYDFAVPVSGRMPPQAQLECRFADGTIEQRELKLESGFIKGAVPRVSQDFTYRVIAGDAETPWNQLIVMDPPRLKELRLRVTPPAYTRLEPTEWNALPRRVEMVEGSRVTLDFTTQQPVGEARIIQQCGKELLTADLRPDGRGWHHFEAVLAEKAEAKIELTSPVGALRSRFPVTFAVRPDQKPKVRLLEKTESFAMEKDEILDVEFEARDDFGIESAEMVAQVTQADGSQEEFRFPIDLGKDAGARELKANSKLDLGKLPLKPGSEVMMSVEVKDHRGLMARQDAGPADGHGKSNKMRELTEALARLDDLAQALKEADQSNDRALDSMKPSQGQGTSNENHATNQTRETESLLGQASRMAPKSTDSGSSSKVSEQVKQAHKTVSEALEHGPKPEALREAKEEIAAARAAAADLANQMRQSLDQELATTSDPASSQAQLMDTLMDARALTEQARNLAGSPQQGGQQNGQQNGQQSGQQSGQQPNQNSQEALKASLDQLARKIQQAEGMAEHSAESDPEGAIENSIHEAAKAAEQARSKGATPERLDQVREHLEKALENMEPAEDVEKRRLDVAKKSEPSSSSQIPVTVDEIANYRIKGEEGKKEQIAIQKVLDLIRDRARDARRLIAGIGEPGNDDKAFAKSLATATPQILDAILKGAEGAESLRERSRNTPYAFFGLQAKAIAETGFTPAMSAMQSCAGLSMPADQHRQLRLADERLKWVIDMLQEGESQFHKMLEYEEAVELAGKFKKMHKIKIEDLSKLPDMVSGMDRSSPYPKLLQELPDSAIQGIIAQQKLKREVLKRLAELLQDKPELRDRLLAQGAKPGKIYREELSKLWTRQQELLDLNAARLAAASGPGANPALRTRFGEMLHRQVAEFSDQSEDALGLARLWIPTDAPAGARRELEEELGMLSNAVAGLVDADPLAAETFGRALSAVRAAGTKLRSLLSTPDWKAYDESYAQFRFDDLKAMSDQLDRLQHISRTMHQGDEMSFIDGLQEKLNADTLATSTGMMQKLGDLSGASPKVDALIDELEKLLSDRLYPEQRAAHEALAKSDGITAGNAMTASVTLLEEATRKLDAAITEFVRARNELAGKAASPGNGDAAPPAKDPSEDEIKADIARLLKQLENEARRQDDPELGIGKQTNLQIEDDWEQESKNKPKSEKEALEKKHQQQMQQAQQAARAAAQAQQQANRQASGIAARLGRSPAVPWKRLATNEADGENDWNVIRSRLHERLTQDVDSSVPEEYRTAIETYFKNIATPGDEAPPTEP